MEKACWMGICSSILCQQDTPGCICIAQTLYYVVHFTLHTVLCTLHTAICTLYTAHWTLYNLHWTLHTAHLDMYATNCTLVNAHPTLYNKDCTLKKIFLYWILYLGVANWHWQWMQEIFFIIRCSQWTIWFFILIFSGFENCVSWKSQKHYLIK